MPKSVEATLAWAATFIRKVAELMPLHDLIAGNTFVVFNQWLVEARFLGNQFY
ncbi:hypothetical protein D3C81_1958540 [compost metagenome]